MKKIFKDPLFTFILGVVLTSGIAVFASQLFASDIKYEPEWKKSNGDDITNVAEAIDELYSKANNTNTSQYDFTYTKKVSSNKIVINISGNDFYGFNCKLNNSTINATDNKCIFDNLSEDTDYNVTIVGTDNNLNTVRKTFSFKTGTSLVMDQTYLASGSTNGNVVITTDNPNSKAGLSITGASTLDYTIQNTTQQIQKLIKWYKEVDLTNYSELVFYAKKGQDHGSVYIAIDNKYVKIINYANLSTSWTQYTVDISSYTGNHTLTIGGGYGDNSGSSSSNTQYYGIELH